MAGTRVRDNPAAGTLTGAEKLYADDGSSDRYVTAQRVASLRQDYVDIRDYHVGTLADGDDITAAFIAAMVDSANHFRTRYHVPRLGTLGFILDPVAVQNDSGFNTNWFTKTIEIEADIIELLTSWNFGNNMRIIGRGVTSSASFLSSPAPRPIIRAHASASVDPIIGIGTLAGFGVNSWLENVELVGDTGPGLEVGEQNLFTLKNCEFSGGNNQPACLINQSFWGNIENCFFQGDAGGDEYCLKITNSIDHGPGGGTDCGLLLFKDIRCANTGILISASYGPTGTNNIRFDRILSEEFVAVAAKPASTALVTLDSGADGIGTSSVTDIILNDCEIADAAGTDPCYIVRNVNTNAQTTGLRYEGRNESHFIDPASDPLADFSVLWNSTNPINTAAAQDLRADFAGTTHNHHISVQYPAAIDTRLLTAPIGVSWVIGDNVPCIQNPASWGGTVTSGLRAPDGSTNAGQRTAGTITFYTGSRTLNVGDWLIVGIWANNTTNGGLDNTNVQVGAGNDYNGDTSEIPFSDNACMEDKFARGWVWWCRALKLTTATGAASTVSFNSTDGRIFFNPSMLHIPVADGYTDDWVLNYARSLRGGWNSAASPGDIAPPPFQRLYLGSGGMKVDAGYLDVTEMAAPSNPAANTARLFTRDNGAGKTQLCVIFPTGAVIALSTEV